MILPGIIAALLLSGGPALPDEMPSPQAVVTTPAVPASEMPVATPPVAADPADDRGQVVSDEVAGEEILVATRRPSAADPVEKINAQSFAVTQSIDKAVIGPASHAFERTVPQPIRSGITNFLNNLNEPVTFLNCLLQIKLGRAVRSAGRFAINTTVGIAGVFDIAKRRPFAIAHRRNGFANTLGFYGVKPGAYLFLPLVGSTSVRDFFGDGLDRLVMPLSAGAPFNQMSFTVPVGVGRTLDHRAEVDEQLQKIRQSADPYAASRDLYLQRRQIEIDELRGVEPETLARNP